MSSNNALQRRHNLTAMSPFFSCMINEFACRKVTADTTTKTRDTIVGEQYPRYRRREREGGERAKKEKEEKGSPSFPSSLTCPPSLCDAPPPPLSVETGVGGVDDMGADHWTLRAEGSALLLSGGKFPGA